MTAQDSHGPRPAPCSGPTGTRCVTLTASLWPGEPCEATLPTRAEGCRHRGACHGADTAGLDVTARPVRTSALSLLPFLSVTEGPLARQGPFTCVLFLF